MKNINSHLEYSIVICDSIRELNKLQKCVIRMKDDTSISDIDASALLGMIYCKMFCIHPSIDKFNLIYNT